MQVWALITDAYGGYGGIALYNREFCHALSLHAEVAKIIVLPRVCSGAAESMPAKVDYRAGAAGSKIRYLWCLLQTLARNGKPAWIMCGHLNLWPLAKLLAVFLKVPVVLILHGVEAWTRPRGLSGDLGFKQAVRVLCVSNITRERFLQWAAVSAENVVAIPNCIHLPDFGLGPKPPYLLERYGLAQHKVVMTVGRLDAREQAKGFDQVLDAMPQLLRAEPTLKYVIVGTGTDLPRLRQKAQSLSISSAVVFTGRIAEPEKADHYRLADVYAMPSRWEGFGFVFLEAMACGIPVVASAVDGGREAVRGGALGRVVDPASTQALVAAILASLQQPKVILPGLDYFSFENFVQRLHAALQPMLAPRGGEACGL